MEEIERISILKSTMHDIFESLSVARPVVYYKVVRCIIHQAQQDICLIDNGFSLSPRKNSCPKTCYLNILSACESMRYRNRVSGDKIRLVVLLDIEVKQISDLVYRLGRLNGTRF